MKKSFTSVINRIIISKVISPYTQICNFYNSKLPNTQACCSRSHANTNLLDSVAPCGVTLSDKIHGFFLYVTHLLIFSKRVRSEMSFQRGKTIMA